MIFMATMNLNTYGIFNQQHTCTQVTQMNTPGTLNSIYRKIKERVRCGYQSMSYKNFTKLIKI